MGEACDGEEELEEATEAMPAVVRARTGLAERLRGGAGEVVGGIWSALACGASVRIGLSHADLSSLFGGSADAGAWAMAISVAVIGGLFPRIGAVLAFVSLAVGMAASSSYVAAALFAAVVAAWFFTCGRLSKAAAVAGSSVAALSLMGALSVLPLRSGLCLRVRDALGTTLFGIASALLLSYCGMGSFTGGGLFVPGSLAGGVEQGVIAQLSNPSVWVVGASWLAAAAVGALLCSRGGRALPALGMASSTAILVFGLMARAFIESGLASWVPDPADIAVVVVFGLAAAGIAAWLGAPVRSNSLRTSPSRLDQISSEGYTRD